MRLTTFKNRWSDRGSSAFAAGAVLMTWPLLLAWALWRRLSQRGRSILPLLALVLCSIGPVQAQQPLNFDFERISVEGPTRPWNWTPLSFAPGAEVLIDDSVVHAGSRSLRISRLDRSPFRGAHAFATYLRPLAALGKRIRVTGWIKTDNLDGRAYITLQTWADFDVLAADTTSLLFGTEEWRRYEINVAVAPETETLVVTANLEGTGTAWFDDLTLEIDGEAVSELPIATMVENEEIEWLVRHSDPLRTVDPTPAASTPDLRDLDALGTIIGDARIVSLGESTHGTSEFFRLKHRVFQYLVRDHGFRLFAIEDQQLGMEKINAYVLHGTGTVEEAMKGMFGVWHTTEVRDLIEWMRAYNSEHPRDPVEFIGFDMQNPSLPIDSLNAFVRRYDRSLYPTLLHLLSDYREAWRRSGYPQYMATDSVRHRWADGAEAAWRLVEARRDPWLRRAGSSSDSLAVEWAVQNARVIAQAGRYIFNYQPDRDSSMAANLKWHLDRRGPAARVAVWAHDSHISKGLAATTQGNYFISSMGSYLDRLFGDAYRAFGLMSYSGAYTAIRSMWGGPRDLAVIEAFPAPPGSLEEAFHRVAERLGTSAFVTDLRPALQDPGGRVLLEGRPYRFVGYAAEDYGFSGEIEIARQFDGLLFVDETSGTRPLGIMPWPPEIDH